MPGVAVMDDVDGKLAKLFGAETSGYVVIYNPQGKLLFNGGITGSRGHAGDNAGLSAAVGWLTDNNSHLRCTSVYGCSLFGDAKFSSSKTNA